MSLYDVELLRPRRSRLWRWFLLHPRADYGWAALLLAGWLGLSFALRQPLLFEDVGESARRTLFQTIATLAGATAGLTLTSVSMLINVLGKRAAPGQSALPVERLTSDHRRRIGEVFLAAIPGLGLLVLAALCTIILEGDGEHGLWQPEAVVFLLLAASVLALLRVAWALRRLLVIATAA